MPDLGQQKETMFRLAHTGLRERIGVSIHSQFRIFTRPLVLHVSHLHAAGDENWKWNAIRSFFVLLQIARVRSGFCWLFLHKDLPAHNRSNPVRMPGARRSLDVRSLKCPIRGKPSWPEDPLTMLVTALKRHPPVETRS